MFVRVDRVSLVRSGRIGLDQVELDLPEGSQIQIGGPSGSGKTTLLKLIAGLLKPDQGTVTWEHEDIWRMPRLTKQIKQAKFGMVFQTDALFDSLSILENVALPLINRNVAPDEASAKSLELLRLFSIEHTANALPEALSGGMKKRVGLARALISQPSVLLADDPLAGLDPHTARSVCQAIEEASKGRTRVIVSSDPIPWLWPLRRFSMNSGRLEEVHV